MQSLFKMDGSIASSKNMNKLFRLILLLFSTYGYVLSLNLEWTPVVNIRQGQLIGVVDRTYNKYLGIPYARVDKRYQAPSEPPSWKNTFYAVKDRNCRQLLPLVQVPIGTEDCLILNVYTPKEATPERPVPVMLFIHGGGFYFGSSTSLFFGPEPLVEKGVAVVTITYRLGASGFLCLGLEGAPGNAGLKDQVAALRWVKQNINAFGGDPTSVTIFGESAGASSVHLLILSKMGKGLFHRAILESNTAQSPVSFAYNPIEKASEVAERMGYKTKDPKELLTIFQNTSLTDIVTATHSVELLQRFNFVPCAEKEFPNVEAFMTETPYQILSSGKYNKVPMMIGYNEREGTLFIGMMREKELAKYAANVELLIPQDIGYKSPRETKRLAKRIRTFYFGNRTNIRENVDEIIDFATDGFFHFSNVQSSRLHVNTSDAPLYNYYFTYESVRNLGKLLSFLPGVRGATHFDEMFYIFRPSIRFIPLFGRDLLMAKRLTQLWTDFAKTSNPTPTTSELLPNLWSPSDSRQLRFYRLDDEMRMIEQPNPTRMDFWRAIYDKYGYRSIEL